METCRVPTSNWVKDVVSSEVLGKSEQKLIRQTGAACEVGGDSAPLCGAEERAVLTIGKKMGPRPGSCSWTGHLS